MKKKQQKRVPVRYLLSVAREKIKLVPNYENILTKLEEKYKSKVFTSPKQCTKHLFYFLKKSDIPVSGFVKMYIENFITTAFEKY